MVSTDENTREFVLDQYKKALNQTEDPVDKDSRDTLLESVYIELHNEDNGWKQIKEDAEKHEDQYDIDLSSVIKFVDKLNDKNIIKSREPEEIQESADEGELQAIKTQIKAQPSKRNLVYTDKRINNNMRNALSEEIYDETGKTAFIISNQREWSGRLTLKLSRTKENFRLMSVYTDQDDNFKYEHFSKKKRTGSMVKIESFQQPLYQYKFVSDNDQQYKVFSEEHINPQRARIKGTKIGITDMKDIGENAQVKGGEDIIFLHSYEPAIEPLDESELLEYRQQIDHDFLAGKLFGEFRHPEWYEKMIIAILMCKDDFGYPSHLLQMAEPGTGKSALLESVTTALAESTTPFSGTSSTVKGLVPSFSETPPDEGYLMRSNRISAVDEMFNLLSNTAKNGDRRMKDAFRPMLDLLEHSNREFSSGNGSVTGKTEAIMFAMGNPAYGLNSIYEAIEKDKIDEAFLSRFIMYDQLDAHIDYINERKAEKSINNDKEMMPETDDEFVSMIDTMRMRNVAGMDYDSIDEMHKSVGELVPSVFETTYNARYQHHFFNLSAGIAKYNYLVDDRDELRVSDEDYDEAKEIMEMIVSSWGDVDKKKMSFSSRVRSLPSDEREVYESVSRSPGVTGAELADRLSERDNLVQVIRKLKELELIEGEEVDNSKKYWPYWSDEGYELRQERKDFDNK